MNTVAQRGAWGFGSRWGWSTGRKKKGKALGRAGEIELAPGASSDFSNVGTSPSGCLSGQWGRSADTRQEIIRRLAPADE